MDSPIDRSRSSSQRSPCLGGEDSCETNPICPRGNKRAKRTQSPACGQEGARAGNPAQADVAGPKRTKRSQVPPDRHKGQVLCGKHVMMNWMPERAWKNEANSGTEALTGHPRGSKCAKRSQFATTNCAKRTQFRRSAGAPEGEMCKTKPISGGAKRAKRSQFAHKGHGRPSPRACPERSEWAGGLDAATPEGTNAQNEANLPAWTIGRVTQWNLRDS